jgi:hypothetical protein
MALKVAADHAKYERLRYVTENFQLLQGFTWAAFGGGLFLLSLEDAPGIELPWWLRLLCIVLGFGLGVAAFRYIPGYYVRRFGSVDRRAGPPRRQNTDRHAFFPNLLFGHPIFRANSVPLPGLTCCRL